MQALLLGVEQRAYALGRAAAEAEVKRLQDEAAAYYRSLEREFQSLSRPGEDERRDQAVAIAVKPYYDAEQELRAMVAVYNKQAAESLGRARELVAQATAIATQAVAEQAQGSTVMAQRHMMQAHQVIAVAGQKKQLAHNIARLAENVNLVIPSYQQAANMAAEHTLAKLDGVAML